MRLRYLLFALILPTFLLLPRIARADAEIAKDADGVQRGGFTLGFGASPGVMMLSDGFVPTTRFHYSFGGAIRPRFVLGLDLSGLVYLGRKKAAFGSDLVGTGFIGRGFYVRAAIGAGSHYPVLAQMDDYLPGIGGFAGIGYEFPLHEKVGMAVGVDYDARVLTNGAIRQTLLAGMRFNFYPGKRKHKRKKLRW